MSRNITIVFVVIAVLLGFLAALVAKRYIEEAASRGRASAEGGGMVQVLVARNDIPVAATLTATDVKMESVPRSIIPRGALTELKAVEGRGVAASIAQGEIVTDGRLTPKGVGGGLQAMVQEGYRAVTVKVNEVVGVAGFIVPGSHVDVLVTIRQENAAGTRIILQDIKVLAAGPYLEKDKDNKPITVNAVTLEVKPDQAEMISHAQNEGEIRLAMRNQLDKEEVATPGTNSTLLLTGGRGAARPSGARGMEVVLGTQVTHQTY